MWPALIFVSLVALIVLDAWRRERRHRRQQSAALQEYTANALRQQQQTNAHAQAQRQALFNSMVEGVLLLGPDDRIQLVNRSLEKLFTLGGDVTGRTLSEALRLPELSALATCLHTEHNVEAVELELPGVPPRLVEVSAAAVLDVDGVPQGAIFVFHDLTRLRQLENTRQEFVANVSHELRTPLSLIKGFVETLREGAKNDPAVAERFLEKIERHTDRLTFLIEDLLTLSKLQSGQTVLNLQRVALREAVQRTLDDLQARAAEKHSTLDNQVSTGLHARADAERLQQVLSNLVDNAIKYGRAGGRVTLGARVLDGARVELSVRDDGPGIPPDSRERVFERFYRVDKARSREQGGTGLGLAIVKHIVQAHGGEVRVESEMGRGTTFFFTLPND